VLLKTIFEYYQFDKEIHRAHLKPSSQAFCCDLDSRQALLFDDSEIQLVQLDHHRGNTPFKIATLKTRYGIPLVFLGILL